MVLPGGMVKWIHTVGHPVLTQTGDLAQFLGSSTDISERKNAEQRLQEQEMELRQILDLSPLHIGVLGPDGTPLYANNAALDYLGVDIDRWRNETSRRGFVHPDDREPFLSERKRRFAEGVPFEYEARLLRRDGQFRYHLFRLNPLKDEQGNVTRWFGTGTDIEDRKQAEDRLRHENIALCEEIDKASMFEEIVGTSPALKTVLSRSSKVAPSDSTVLITGETGTGKELVARAIHRRSDRVSRPFVSVNCSAIPRDLIASELFGHEKGAFTGATQQRLGRFELANGGTLLLVEYFIDRYARKAGKNIKRVNKKTLELLQSYPWPGNIRELQNVIERSVIVCETENFSVDKSWLSQQPRDTKPGSKLHFSQLLAATEKEVIEEALRESQGRVFGPSGAAAKLGLARSTLESKIRSLNINKKRFTVELGS